MAIIIDAEKPHACWACDFRCGLNIIARTEEEGIHDDCPIIGEIPDVHGRLIDADALAVVGITDYKLEGHTVVEIEDIQNAPTILGARNG
jgi:hypothetical protein